MMPEWTGSFGTTLSWKNIVLNALIDVRYGGQFLSMTDAYATGAGNSKRTLNGRDGMVVNGIVESSLFQDNRTRKHQTNNRSGILRHHSRYLSGRRGIPARCHLRETA